MIFKLSPAAILPFVISLLAQQTASYEFAGDLTKPYQPAGGVGVGPTDPPPVYAPLSNFDFQSLVRIVYTTSSFTSLSDPQNLALNQEWIELDLFHHGLAIFSNEEFDAWNLTAEDRYLIQFMWACFTMVPHVVPHFFVQGRARGWPCNSTVQYSRSQRCQALQLHLPVPDRGRIYQLLPNFDSLGRSWSIWLPSSLRLATQCTNSFTIYHHRGSTANGFRPVPGLSQLSALFFRDIDEACRGYSQCPIGSIWAYHRACTCHSSIWVAVF